ncbi:MAG: sensor histidine kinase [Gammaproteobacteria bacterium]|nr:sensor histidine kinase [Gammaproteobacteria bacterium]
MRAEKRPYLLARSMAWATWLLVGIPEVVDYVVHGAASGGIDWRWIAAYLAFGPTLYAPLTTQFPGWLQLVRLSVATAAPLVMVYVDPHSFACTLWVIAAWELAIALPLRIMLPWVLALSLAMAALMARGLTTRYAFQEIAIFCAFQVYAVITAYVARSESLLRRELAAANMELRSTQSLLAHSVRSGERLRISRELHDLIGHHLAALILNLEVARHQQAAWQPRVLKAQDIARRLLGDVREVVKLLRVGEHTNLKPMLEQIVADIPHIQVHLRMAEPVPIDDARLAQVTLRVVQETVTNAIKHSGCTNLWLEISSRAGLLEIRAEDDGRGASEVRWGAGLTGIRERLEEIGGSMHVIAQGGRGFKLEANLPLGMPAS